MPAPIAWTPAQDHTIRTMRLAGATWEKIAARLGCAPYTANERGKRIGAVLPPVEYMEPERDPEPFPAGHSVTWGAITAGTVLDGAPWRVTA